MPLRTVIVERRSRYENDRTWCFWRMAHHPFESLVSQSWDRMRLRTAECEVVADCGATPYQMLPSDAFYRNAVDRITAAPDVDLMLGTRVHGEPVAIPGGWAVETGEGVLRTRRIISRPPTHLRADDAVLWQSFVGEEVECEVPVFDPGLIELMDFSECSADGIAFTYVLPVSETRALVEFTVFGPTPLSAPQLAASQRAAIARITRGAATRTLRQERGILPMGLNTSPTARESGYSYAGLMSGAARPSTGYAFQRIQRWAAGEAAALTAVAEVKDTRPTPSTSGPWTGSFCMSCGSIRSAVRSSSWRCSAAWRPRV
ncbi:MAG: lycopene cyclase family protein [Gemmatimonadaceae bacterium]|nr:lycopene cyclase family protein [Gemmatimonadaceae bacterium]